jgi:hypothetical protein
MMIKEESRFDWAGVFKLGLLGGIAALYVCLVGLVGTFAERDIIGGVVAFGHTLLMLAALGIGYVASRHVSLASEKTGRIPQILLGAGLSGLVTGAMVALLVVVAEAVNLRAVLLNVSPELIDLLRFKQDTAQGVLLLLLAGTVVGVLGGGIYLLPTWLRNSLLASLAVVIVFWLVKSSSSLFQTLSLPLKV